MLGGMGHGAYGSGSDEWMVVVTSSAKFVLKLSRGWSDCCRDAGRKDRSRSRARSLGPESQQLKVGHFHLRVYRHFSLECQ
jgi:hypothetical protein